MLLEGLRMSSRRATLPLKRALATAVLSLVFLVPLLAQESVDLDAVHRIREEALQNSQVMDHLFYLTDANGPRLTNSPGFFAAADWVVKQLTPWGISPHQEKWGPYGRGWTFTPFSAHLIEPQYAPLIGVPLAYTPGTNGPVTAEATIAAINSEADFAKYRGTLKGKIVLLGAGRELTMSTDPLGTRRSDADLAAIALPPRPAPGGARPPGAAAIVGAPNGRGGGPGAQQFQQALNRFLSEEGAAVVVRPGGARSEGGTVFAQAGGSRDIKDPVPPPMVALTLEHYNRIARL